MRPKWGDYFMLMAKIAASRSVCNSRPTGCVLVRDNQILSTGYNGPPPQAKHCSEIGGKGYCHRRAVGASNIVKQDNCLASHAEINAISMAAKRWVAIEGSILYITLNPCLVCLKALRVAGVSSIIYELKYDLNTVEDYDKYAKGLGFSNCFQWQVDKETTEFVKAFLEYPTSYRRKPATE